MSEKARPLFAVEVKRSFYGRRFIRHVIGLAATAGAYGALREAAARGVVDSLLLDAGLLVAIFLGGYFAVRALINLWRWLTRPTETLRFFEKGFVWADRRGSAKYPWTRLERLREGVGALTFFDNPLLYWGAHRLTMDDGRVFRFTPRHGDPRRFIRAIRPYAAEVTSLKMSEAIRDEQPVTLHPRLIVYPGGVAVGKREIPWSELEVKVVRGRLVLYRKSAKKRGGFEVVKRLSLRRVDNVGGFIELARGAIRNFQSERFKRRPQRAEAMRRAER